MNRGELSVERTQFAPLGEEIAATFPTELPNPAWAEAMLARLVAAVEAEGGVLWTPNEASDRLQPAVVIGPDYWSDKTALADEAPIEVGGAALRQEIVTDPLTADGTDDTTPLRALFLPLVAEDSTRGVVQLIWSVDSPGPTHVKLLPLLERICPSPQLIPAPFATPALSDPYAPVVAPSYSAEHSAIVTAQLQQVPAPATATSDEAELFVRMHQSLSLKEVLSVAVNDGRRWLNCDRVSAAIKDGDSTTIRAMTGEEEVNPRGNHVRLLAALTDLVLRSREPLLYTGDASSRPEPIEKALAEYLHEGRSRMVAIFPLTAPKKLVTFHEEQAAAVRKREPPPPELLGALIIEQVTDAAPRTRPGRAELLAKHLSAAMANARTYESVFMLPVLSWVGRELSRLRGKRLAKFGAFFGALAVAVAALFLVPWEYRVEGKGHLMPALRHNVYSPLDGEIVELLVRGGEQVKKDQVLLRLRNEDLQMQSVNAQNQLQEKESQVYSLKAELDSATAAADRQGETRAHAKLVQARLERDGLKQQLALLDRQLAELTIRAPSGGVVATFRIDQLLAHRPVRRGDLLIEVMEVDGPWRLELDVPEQRLGRLARAARVDPSAAPIVDFVLATATEKKWQARLENISARANVSEVDGAIVEVTALLPPDQVPERRIGADVTARIHCGPSKLGYVLFGDVIEYVRRRIWW